MKISELFNKISKTSGAAAKAALMNDNMTDVIKQIFEDTYDNSRKYFVKKFEMPETYGKKTLEKNYPEFHKMLQTLADRLVTGGNAIALVEQKIAEFNEEDADILARIMDRNLKIGLSKDSFAKLLGEEAPKKFEVTLAVNLDNAKGVNPLDGTFYASRKCDGTRCIGMCKKAKGKVEITFLSRGNKEFTTLDKVKPALTWYLRDLPDGDYVTDGELCKVDKNGDEDFQAIMKEIKKKDWTIADPCYQMFDFCTLDEFNGVKKSVNFTGRYTQMQKMMKGNKFPEIKLLKQELIKTQEDFDRWSKYVEEGNWEGFMLRKDIPFETGRSKNLLKVKKFDDAEYVVKNVEIGEMTTAEPMLGNVTFEGVRALFIEHKGNTVRVGSGLTKEQRIAWKKDPSKIIGKTICVKYFEETKNQNGTYSLRFPILKWVYDGKRDC
jgi:DNA ligase-1